MGGLKAKGNLKVKKEWRSEGILLCRTPYQERHFITTFFTPDKGLTRLFFAKKKGEPLDPLTALELVCQATKGDFLKVIDSSRIETFQGLRSSYLSLMLAGKMGKSLLKTQLEGKPSENLYTLFKLYLRQMGKSENPPALCLSFLLKLMRHEGGLTFSSTGLALEYGSLSLPGISLNSQHILLASRRFDQIEAVKASEEAIEEVFSRV